MFRSTILLKYLNNLHRHQNAQIFSYKLIRHLSSKDTGLIRSSGIKPDTDILLQNLKNSITTQNVFNIISDHHKIMNNKHLLQALKSLFVLQKSKNSNVSTEEIILDPNFHVLCNLLKSQVRSVELRDAIEALKIVSFMGIPSDSSISQVLLQIIKHDVNHLSLQQIIFLNYIVRQFKATPLSDAVLMALPIIFEVQMPLKLDRENIGQITDCLQYASRIQVSIPTLEILVNSLMKHKHINPKDAIRIVWSLCDLRPHEMFGPLLNKALRIIIDNDNKLKFTDIETILTKLASRINRHRYYYNEKFFNMVADKTVDENLGMQQALFIQIKLNKVGHFHQNLLNYIASNYDENIISNNPGNLITLINGFSLSEYKPRLDWNKFTEYINIHFDITKYGLDSIKFSTKLAILDIYLPKILQYTFKEEHLQNIIQNGTLDACRMYLTLYQSVYVTQEEYRKYLPPYTKILKLIERYTSLNIHDSIHGMPLKNALEKAYGGKQYILSNCMTRRGISVQHAIIMRKGGFPVAFHNTAEQSPIILDELIYPADSKIIAILGLNPSCFCLNNNILKGLYSLIVRTLEASNFSVVTIPIQTWNEFPEHERIPYLMRAIRNKSESLEEIHATV